MTPPKLHMLTYFDKEGRPRYWGVWVCSGVFPPTGFSVVAIDGEVDGPVAIELYFNSNMCLQIDDLVYTSTFLADIDVQHFGSLQDYARTCNINIEAEDPGNEFPTSRLWMWHFVEGLVQRGIVPGIALRTCQIHLRDRAQETWRLVDMVRSAMERHNRLMAQEDDDDKAGEERRPDGRAGPEDDGGVN
ncbi:hypothetical protein CDD83_11055 [Cordyceps sp. RAO-2017]|nr:hypothetical protein CDD83_11055 [Cordyceps sp. RAO-2017]